MGESRPRVAYFKEFIPTPVCIFLSMSFAIVFQFNGGVFIPVATQMSSALGRIYEDVVMAGYASFIGTTLIFPILFRLKRRFTTRTILMTVCPVLICCNLVTMHSNNMLLLTVACFVSGFFRMWGTFECFSNMRLTITPEGNFSVFYPFIYIIVLESIQLSGLTSTYISDWGNWRYMHWMVIGLLIAVWLCVFVLTRHIRIFPKLPLINVDWIGCALWGIMLFAIVFVCIYGEYYDWFDSIYIRGSIVVAVTALMLNINRMTSIHRPYIPAAVFRYRKFPVILLLFLILCLFLTTSSVLQNKLLTSILNFDPLNVISLNWFSFAGILAGAGIVFYRQVIMRKGYKLLIFIGFLLLTIYEYYMYFLIYPELNIESLYLPNFLKGVAHGVLYIALTIYIAKSIPFKHFFQALCVLGFIRTSLATPLGTAILNRWLRYQQQDNMGLITGDIDRIKDYVPDFYLPNLYNEVMRQTTMLGLKEVFGGVCVFGTVLVLVIMSYRIWQKGNFVERGRREFARIAGMLHRNHAL